jgi:hypothetical protein
MPPVLGAKRCAAIVARCFCGAFPPVDLSAVCLTLAIVNFQRGSIFGVFVRVICGWMLCSLEQKGGSIASHFE